MKVISIPSSGKRGNIVAYNSRYGICHRALVVPANPRTPARQHMRGAFGSFARAWSRVLTQAQREAWDVAGPTVQSKRRLGSGPLTGQQLFQGLNSARACIGLKGLLLLPPAPVVFGPNPVAQLTIRNGEDGVRLLLNVADPVTEDIMVFGQAPCSAGRMKRRNVAYLGLLPAPQNGLSDITAIYVARYGEPRPGEKVFIVTCQQKDGWEGFDKETNEIVPDKPADQQASNAGALTLQSIMHKGCTPDAQGIGSQPVPNLQTSGEPASPSVEAAKTTLGEGNGDGQRPIADGQSRPNADLGGHEAVRMETGEPTKGRSPQERSLPGAATREPALPAGQLRSKTSRSGGFWPFPVPEPEACPNPLPPGRAGISD